MQPRSRARLWDARRAVETIARFVVNRSWDEYQTDDMLRSAVERQFEIAGEALAQLRRTDAETATQVPDLARIVAFRNLLIHGYGQIDHELVWRTATVDAPILATTITELLDADG